VVSVQTISIAAGAALISFVDYKLLLLVVSAVVGACALLLLIRPAPEPAVAAARPAAAAPESPDAILDPVP
jgi:hypothetical protein